jgi:hypothetical protein
MYDVVLCETGERPSEYPTASLGLCTAVGRLTNHATLHGAPTGAAQLAIRWGSARAAQMDTKKSLRYAVVWRLMGF